MDIQSSPLCNNSEEVSNILNILTKLNTSELSDYEAVLDETDKSVLKQACDSKFISNLTSYNPNDDSGTWKYLCSLLYLISCLDTTFAQKEELKCLSVQQTKDLKDIIKTIIDVGILENIQPALLHSKSAKVNPLPDLVYYKRLVGTLYGINISFKSPFLKSLLVTNYLRPVLLSFYQILHCPLKRPNTETNSFVMTQQIYDDLINDREHFRRIFKVFVSSVHPMLYIRESMLLFDKSSPNWLKKSLSNTLSTMIRSSNGVQNVMWAMLDSVGLDELDDSTKSWEILLVIARLIMDTGKCADFKDNICKQVSQLLKLRSKSGEAYKPFERLFALCTKMLYQQDEGLCKVVFITDILESLVCFTYNKEKSIGDCEIVNDFVPQSVRVCYYLTTEVNYNIPAIPVTIVLPVFNVLWRLFLINSQQSNLNDDIKNIFLNYLNNTELNKIFELFDTLLFGSPHQDILEMQKGLEFCLENTQIIMKHQAYTVKISCLKRAEAISELINDNTKIRTVFFSYLLNCLSKHDKYFSGNVTSTNLLELEEVAFLQESSERSIATYKLLSELASDKSIQTEISKNPALITTYIKTVIQKYVDKGLHKTVESDSDSFQTLFLLVMLLQVFVEGSNNETKVEYCCFIEILQLIHDECSNTELKVLCNQILVKLDLKTDVQPKQCTKSELDQIFEDICDPLLPVRGHALMALSKLIAGKNKEAMDRKQYILNIFMQNLKNDDSFIYLSAIGGLAAMGDVFPDTVLNTLTDEYVDFSRKSSEDGEKVRMKLGEVLVRITKALGNKSFC